MVENVEAQFHKAMIGVFQQAKEECGYVATRFLQLVSEQGGLRAAKNLLHKERPSDGLFELWKRGRLDLSMEALVLQEPWFELFTEEELKEARRRLQELGFELP